MNKRCCYSLRFKLFDQTKLKLTVYILKHMLLVSFQINYGGMQSQNDDICVTVQIKLHFYYCQFWINQVLSEEIITKFPLEKTEPQKGHKLSH